MARDHGRIKTAIWRDAEFRALPMEPQWLYMAMLTQQSLSYAGVLDWRPGRLAALATGVTVRKIDAAARSLTAARFVVIDEQTEEALVRTYVRHDGVLDRVNMGKAVARALQDVVSLEIRLAIIVELGRLYRESPKLQGWVGIGDLAPDVMADVVAMASPMESRKA